jgi:hypothetical protein
VRPRIRPGGEEGGPDRAVADLGRDRDRAGEGGEERAGSAADLEDVQLRGAA